MADLYRFPWLLAEADREGYYATVCRGVDEALRVIEQYLAQPRTQVVPQ